MSHLPVPVREVLNDNGADAVAVERVLRGWQRRRALRRARVGAAVAVAVAAAASLWVVFSPRAVAPPGPLTLEDGSAPRVFEAGAARLDDRSRVVVRDGRVEVLANTGRAFASRLDHGRARFEVTPGGPRRWSVTCDGVVVEVTGTVFEVAREPAAVRVAVERGSVRVSGARVTSPRTLAAGQWMRVELRDAPAPVAREEPLIGPPEPTSPRVAPPVAARAAPRAVDTAWRDLARRGDYALAYDQLGAGGIARVERASTADDLLALADVARLSGHPAEAVSPLERVLREHPGDPAAPLAAFALGRLQLDALGQPRRAAEALERALSLGVARSLEEDVRARLVEAHARAGDTERARSAAGEYLRRFPQGRRAAAVRRQAELP